MHRKTGCGWWWRLLPLQLKVAAIFVTNDIFNVSRSRKLCRAIFRNSFCFFLSYRCSVCELNENRISQRPIISETEFSQNLKSSPSTPLTQKIATCFILRDTDGTDKNEIRIQGDSTPLVKQQVVGRPTWRTADSTLRAVGSVPQFPLSRLLPPPPGFNRRFDSWWLLLDARAISVTFSQASSSILAVLQVTQIPWSETNTKGPCHGALTFVYSSWGFRPIFLEGGGKFRDHFKPRNNFFEQNRYFFKFQTQAQLSEHNFFFFTPNFHK